MMDDFLYQRVSRSLVYLCFFLSCFCFVSLLLLSCFSRASVLFLSCFCLASLLLLSCFSLASFFFLEFVRVLFAYRFYSPISSSSFIAISPPAGVLNLAIFGFRLLNSLSICDLIAFQKTVGQEGISLEFRHIATYLIRRCLKALSSTSSSSSSSLSSSSKLSSRPTSASTSASSASVPSQTQIQRLLHEVILAVGLVSSIVFVSGIILTPNLCICQCQCNA